MLSICPILLLFFTNIMSENQIFRIECSDLQIPEIHLINVIRGTFNGIVWLRDHHWQEVRASWVNRNFVSELQTCINRKNSKYQEYRKNCNECWLLIVTNRSKDSQAFEITEETLQWKYISEFERTFYMEVLFRELHELSTKRR